MKAQTKNGLAIIFLFSLFVISLCVILYLTTPYDELKEVWMPRDASIVNLIDGKFIPVSEVFLSGTAVFVPFEEYKSNVSVKAESENSVIFSDAYGFYYLTKTEERLYVAKTKVDHSKFFVPGVTGVVYVPGEESAQVKIHWSTNITETSIAIALCFLFSVIFFAIWMIVKSK